MNVGRPEATKHILNANCYGVAPIARISKVKSCVPMVHNSQEHKCTISEENIGLVQRMGWKYDGNAR